MNIRLLNKCKQGEPFLFASDAPDSVYNTVVLARSGEGMSMLPMFLASQVALRHDVGLAYVSRSKGWRRLVRRFKAASKEKRLIPYASADMIADRGL
jgi:type IV secretory pathway VirB4 component